MRPLQGKELKFRGWGMVESEESYNSCAKIVRFGVFLRKLWTFENRDFKLYLLLLFCEYTEFCKSFWRSNTRVWKLTWQATSCVKKTKNFSLRQRSNGSLNSVFQTGVSHRVLFIWGCWFGPYLEILSEYLAQIFHKIWMFVLKSYLWSFKEFGGGVCEL